MERDSLSLSSFHIYINLVLIWCGSSIYLGTEACNFFFFSFLTCEGILNVFAWQIGKSQVVYNEKILNIGKTPSCVL